MILTDIGEIGVYAGAECYVLRPSLYAMSRLGNPQEIVKIYATVMSDADGPNELRRQFAEALAVIYTCQVGDADMSSVFGHIKYVDHKKTHRYVVGQAPVDHILHLARCLLKHGIIGALPPLPVKRGEAAEYTNEFVARDLVAMAMAHLGIAEVDAWGMTMTSLIAALRAKFPPVKSNESADKAPSSPEHHETMAWMDRIDAARKARKGVH